MVSKFDAFNSRGANDPRTSHDPEDLVYIIDNRIDIFEQLNTAQSDVKPWLVEQLQSIWSARAKQEAVIGNLTYQNRAEHFNRIIDIIKKFVT